MDRSSFSSFIRLLLSDSLIRHDSDTCIFYLPPIMKRRPPLSSTFDPPPHSGVLTPACQASQLPSLLSTTTFRSSFADPSSSPHRHRILATSIFPLCPVHQSSAGHVTHVNDLPVRHGPTDFIVLLRMCSSPVKKSAELTPWPSTSARST